MGRATFLALLGCACWTGLASSAINVPSIDSRAAISTTNATGGFAVSWTPPLRTATPFAAAVPMSSSATQLAGCNVVTSTAAGVTGVCLTTQISTVGALNAVVSPVIGDAYASVRVFARDLTQ